MDKCRKENIKVVKKENTIRCNKCKGSGLIQRDDKYICENCKKNGLFRCYLCQNVTRGLFIECDICYSIGVLIKK